MLINKDFWEIGEDKNGTLIKAIKNFRIDIHKGN